MSIHAGHRQRLKERFLKESLDNFEEHQVLELLLFYAIPQRNVNPLAHQVLERFGAVSAPVAEAMAVGARNALEADVAVSVTGLAGPGGDDFGNEVGTVFIGFSHSDITFSREFHFTGDRESVRMQTVKAALQLLLDQLNQEVFK